MALDLGLLFRVQGYDSGGAGSWAFGVLGALRLKLQGVVRVFEKSVWVCRLSEVRKSPTP